MSVFQIIIGGGKRQFFAKTSRNQELSLEYSVGELILLDQRGSPGYETWPHIGEVSKYFH